MCTGSLYSQRHSIDPSRGSIKALLAVIAKRRAVDLIRAHKNIIATIHIDEVNDTACASFYEVDFETKSILIDSIRSLGPPDSEILIRKYYFGQTTKIIASALGIKVNTVDKRVSRSLNKLREVLGGVF